MRIKIGYKMYEVIEVAEDGFHDAENEYVGTCDFKENVIRINETYPDETKKACLIHEVIHAIDNMFVADLDETQVATLANGIYTVIHDNPSLIKKILEG